MMDWIYFAISWILLRWHQMWAAILPGGATFLATTWDWILAIVFLVITVRIVLFPVFVKQIRSQRAMQALQPKLKELQEKHKGDRETLQRELMELYRREKVNPLMGCLPIFLQIPVFLSLFHVLRRLNPGRTDPNTGLYGWTYEQFHDASVARLFDAPIAARFASSAGDLAGMNANGTAVKIIAGILVIMMMVTTFLTSRQMILKTGWSQDPQQRMIQRLMLYGIPISLLLSGWYFPIGVIIYWVTQNLFSLGQQFWVLHKYPPPALAGAGTAAGKATPAAKTVTANASTRQSKARPSKAPTGADAEGNKPGLFRRKRDTAVPTVAPKLDGKALAPKPGAKPASRKPGNRKKGGAKR